MRIDPTPQTHRPGRMRCTAGLLLCAGFWPGGRLWAVLTDVRLSCAMALYIWVTHLIYQFVLVPEQKRKGQRFADFGGSFGNICVHYLTPLLVVAQWLFLADKKQKVFQKNNA